MYCVQSFSSLYCLISLSSHSNSSRFVTHLNICVCVNIYVIDTHTYIYAYYSQIAEGKDKMKNLRRSLKKKKTLPI